MDLTTERNENVLSLGVKGRIDGSTAVAFEEAVRNAIDETDRALIMDFGDLDYSSSGAARYLADGEVAAKPGRQAGALRALRSDSRGVQDQRVRQASSHSRHQEEARSSLAG